MKQHKLFTNHVSKSISTHLEQSVAAFERLASIYADRDKTDFDGIKKAYQNFLMPKTETKEEEKKTEEKKTEEKKEEEKKEEKAEERKLRYRHRHRRHFFARRKLEDKAATTTTENKTEEKKTEEKKTEEKKTEEEKKEEKKVEEKKEEVKKEAPKLSPEHVASLAKLETVIDECKKKKGEDLNKQFTSLKDAKEYNEKITKVRSGLLCGICNPNTHRHFDLEERTLTYSAPFCFKLVSDFFPSVHDKYVELVKYLLDLSEFAFILTKKHLVTDTEYTKRARKYITMLEKCKKKPDDLKECSEFCAEFKVNKQTEMFDGEIKIFEEAAKAYETIGPLITDPKKHTEIFNLRARELSEAKFLKQHNYLKTDSAKKEDFKKVKTNSYGVHMKVRDVSTFTENNQFFKEIPGVQGESAKTAVILFPKAATPVAMSDLKIVINKDTGYNAFTEGEKVDFAVSPEQCVALLFTSEEITSAVKEKIDAKVVKVLEENNVEKIRVFINTPDMLFKRWVNPKSLLVEKKVKKLIGKKKKTAGFVGIAVSFVMLGIFK